MAEVTTRTTTVEVPDRISPAAAARLRSLSRPGFDPRTYLATISTFEIAAIAGVLLIAIGAIFVYSFWILPDQVSYSQAAGEVTANKAKIDDLQQQIDDPSEMRDEFTRTQESLSLFRGDMLKPRREGRLEIIDTVDRLTRETGVRLTSPVSFTTSMPSEARERQSDGEGQIRSYPALQLSFSISGRYEQIRNFISRFEASRQFVVIDAVGIGVGSDEDGGSGGAVAAPQGTVGVDISLTAYFQPEAAALPAAQ